MLRKLRLRQKNGFLIKKCVQEHNITRKQQKMYFKYIRLRNCLIRSEGKAITRFLYRCFKSSFTMSQNDCFRRKQLTCLLLQQ